MNHTIDSAPTESKNGTTVTQDDLIRGYSLGF